MYSVPPAVSTMFTLWLPPKVWLHGSQSTMTGRSPARKGQACLIICWFAASIRWVLSTPLGAPVDPEVKRIFATASGPSAAKAASTSGPASVASRLASRCAPGLLPAEMIAGSAPTASRAGPKRSASSANTAPGLISSVISRIRAWSRLISE